VWITSHIGRVKAQVKLMEGVNPDTVWTWNAIGKRSGAWGLDNNAPEATHGFLLNHLISELLPEREGGYRYSNSDPVTGQAAWYDLRIRIEKAKSDEAHETHPRFEPLKPLDHIRTPGVLSFGAEFAKKGAYNGAPPAAPSVEAAAHLRSVASAGARLGRPGITPFRHAQHYFPEYADMLISRRDKELGHRQPDKSLRRNKP